MAGTNCKLIDSKDYQFKIENIKVQAYLYNIPNLSDDESIFYFNNKYGVIAEYSLAWSDTKVLYNQEELKPLQDSILKNFNRFLLIGNMIKMSKY